ncbi:MAG: hypothetical protein FK734_02875 [Asgard group archaeon]|nr:hypothetical protein [Asgard group archaeon]
MSDNNYNNINHSNEEIVNNFLEEVRKKLPFWMKEQKEDTDEILEELETHIWDKAAELAENGDISQYHIEQAIELMGSPSKIAAEYKHRGKPKFFITEELFPMYTKSIIISSAIFFGINLLAAVFSIGSKTASEIFGGFFNGVFISTALVLILITIQFVYLSKEGYLPEDFRRMTKRINVVSPREYLAKKSEPKPIISKTAQEETTTTYAPVQMVKETEVKIQTKPIIVEPVSQVRVKEEKPIKVKRKVKTYYTGRNYLSEGIFGIVFGVIIIILPFLPILDFLDPAVQIWIALFGGTAVFAGVIRFLQAIVGRALRIQQGLMLISLIPSALNILLFLRVLRDANLTNGVMNLLELIVNKIGYGFNQEIAMTAVTVFIYVVVAVTAISIIAEIGRIIALEVRGFPVKQIEEYH